MPSDIEDANTNKSIIGVRVGTGQNLEYKDKREWVDELEDVAQTQVTTQATSGQTTLEIDNSYDFADSGSVDVYVSGTKYSITYTGVTRSSTAGILTGVPASGTGSISVTIPVDTNVWQNQREGLPRWYSVWDGTLRIWPLPDSSSDNANVYADYHTVRTSVNSAADTIEGSRYDMVKHWLIAKIRAQSNATGMMDANDFDWQLFLGIVADLIRKELSGQRFKMSPRVNQISLSSRRGHLSPTETD